MAAADSSSPLKMIFVGLVLLFCSVAVESRHGRKVHRIVVVRVGPARDEFRGTVYLGYNGFKIIDLLLSTGYNLAYFYCNPCPSCYPPGEIFNPSNSSSYLKVNCLDDEYCTTLRQHECDAENNCKFSIGQPPGNHLSGFIANDKLRFGSHRSRIILRNFHFGCVHQYSGPPEDEERAIGVFGLGPKSNIIVTLAKTIFSYCFPLSKHTGWVDFGDDVEDPGHNAVTTAFVDHYSNEYRIKINSFTVENQPTIFINQPHKTFWVNTGSQMSYVDLDTMQGLMTSFRAAIPYPAMKTKEPALASNSQYNLCFNIPAGDIPWMPSMIVEFHEGAWIRLHYPHYLQRIDENTMCLTILSVEHMGSGGRPTFGNQLAKGREFVHHLGEQLIIGAPGKC